MRSSTAIKTDIKDTIKTSFGANLLVITFRVATIFTLLVIVSIGAWAVLALMGGMVSSGDPLTMIADWFKAIQGK
jgi:hypothetical protein